MAKAAMQTNRGYDTYVVKLIEFSNTQAVDPIRARYGKPWSRLTMQSPISPQSVPPYSSNEKGSSVHAEPISSLRTQDLTALSDLFDGEKTAIAAEDVHQHLARLCPEPCWEDEPYEFLRGYL